MTDRDNPPAPQLTCCVCGDTPVVVYQPPLCRACAQDWIATERKEKPDAE